jgi:hypothetical protein
MSPDMRSDPERRVSDSMRDWLVASPPPYCHMAIPIIEKRGHVDLSLRPRLFKDKFVGSGLSEPSVTLLVIVIGHFFPQIGPFLQSNKLGFKNLEKQY